MTPTDPEKPASEISRLARLGNIPFVAIVRVYRITLSPFVGRQCRYHPTCSAFSLEAYRLHGPVRGSLLTCARILRCHPFVKGGYDPVPIPHNPEQSTPESTPATPVTGQSDP